MATYTFLNKNTNTIEEHVMSMLDYDQFKINNPHLERYIDSAPIVSFNGTGDNISKTDNTWKEVLAKIGEQNPRSPLADRFRKKTAKEIKVNDTIEKHKRKRAERLKRPK